MTLTLDRPATTLPRPVGAGTQVPLVTGGRAEYANLDLAASAPALEAVAAHVADDRAGRTQSKHAQGGRQALTASGRLIAL